MSGERVEFSTVYRAAFCIWKPYFNNLSAGTNVVFKGRIVRPSGHVMLTVCPVLSVIKPTSLDFHFDQLGFGNLQISSSFHQCAEQMAKPYKWGYR